MEPFHPGHEPAEWSRHYSKMSDPTRPSRAISHEFFHDDKVPDDVKAADDALAVRAYAWMFPAEKWGLQDDASIPEAARRIDVPIFLGFGARDVAPDPHIEPRAYPNSGDITIFILPDSAHCFNFADTRRLVFDRLAGWGHEVSKTYRQAQESQGRSAKDVRPRCSFAQVKKALAEPESERS